MNPVQIQSTVVYINTVMSCFSELKDTNLFLTRHYEDDEKDLAETNIYDQITNLAGG